MNSEDLAQTYEPSIRPLQSPRATMRLSTARSTELVEGAFGNSQLPYLLISLYPTFLKLHDIPQLRAMTGGYLLYVIGAIPMITAILLNFLSGKGRIGYSQLPLFLSILSFIGLMLVSIFRYASIDQLHVPEAIKMSAGVIFIALGAFSFCWNPAKNSLRCLVSAIYVGLVLFISANLILHLAGVRPDEAFALSHENEDGIVGRNATLAALGIVGERIRLPLVTGINAFGIICGACLLLGLIQMHTSRIRGCIASTIAIIGVVMTDTRAAIIYSIAAYALFLLLRTRLRIHLTFAMVFFPFLSFLAFPLLATVAPIFDNIGLTEAVFRKAIDKEQGNSRVSIYQTTLNTIIQHPIEFAVGHGFVGHETSGAAIAYSQFLTDTDAKRSARRTPHNVILSIMLDQGLLGLFIFLTITILAAHALAMRAEPSVYATTALLAYSMAAGATEATPTPYYFEMLWIWFLLIFGIISVTCSARVAYVASR